MSGAVLNYTRWDILNNYCNILYDLNPAFFKKWGFFVTGSDL